MESIKERAVGLETADRFDAVHDTQHIYRALLEAMAFPGTVQDIGPVIQKLDDSLAFNRTAAGIALTLLDAEVSHAVQMAEATLLPDYIRRMTFSPAAPMNDADYVFADGDMDAEAIARIMESVKRGTHEAPDFSATLLLEVRGFVEEQDGRRLVLSGPGIAIETECRVSGLTTEWLMEREKANAEYPVGVDLILYTGEGHLVALPRTTNIKEVER